jgi:hypothetical protein
MPIFKVLTEGVYTFRFVKLYLSDNKAIVKSKVFTGVNTLQIVSPKNHYESALLVTAIHISVHVGKYRIRIYFHIFTTAGCCISNSITP